MSRAPASTSRWRDAPETCRGGQLLRSWSTSSTCSSGQLARDRQLRRWNPARTADTVWAGVGGELGLLLRRVRPLTVKRRRGMDIGFDLHLGALVGHFGDERAIGTANSAHPVLTTMASSVVAMTLPSKGFGSM